MNKSENILTRYFIFSYYKFVQSTRISTVMSLTVKVYFEKEGGQPDIRRFSVDQQVASNVEYLKMKIRQVFPDIGANNVTLYWKDADNDNVMFSTDDELTDALGYVNDGLFKVHVKVCADQKSRDTVHPGVKCDGCECDMIGYRYKCLICPDFDLCETCQKKGCHSEHTMMCIRTPQQVSPPRGFFKRMFREHMRNHAKMAQDLSDKEETETGAGEKETDRDGTQQQSAEECLKNVHESISAMLDPLGIDVSIDVHPDRGHHHRRRWGRCGGGRGRGGWGHCGPWFGGWQGEGWCGTNPSSQPTAEKETDVEMSAQESSPPHEGATCCGTEDMADQQKKKSYCCGTQNMADQQKKKSDCCGTENMADQQKIKSDCCVTENMAGQQKKTSYCCDTQKMADHQKKKGDCCGTENMADQQKKKSDCYGVGGCGCGLCNVNASGKSGSWIFIDNQQSPMTTGDCPISPTRDDQPSTSSDNVMTSSAPEQLNPVATSLQRMKQMGFTDELGWLTNLLQMKNGSIEQVLEIIQPNK